VDADLPGDYRVQVWWRSGHLPARIDGQCKFTRIQYIVYIGDKLIAIPRAAAIAGGRSKKLGCVVLQWLKRLDAHEAGRRHNATITFSHNGELYVLLHTSRDTGTTSVSTTRKPDASYVSELTLSQVTPGDAGLYVCVVTGKYGLRSYQAASLTVHSAAGQSAALCFINSAKDKVKFNITF